MPRCITVAEATIYMLHVYMTAFTATAAGAFNDKIIVVYQEHNN